MEITNLLQATRLNDSSPEDIVGSIRINPKCYTDAFITDPAGGYDIYLEGSQSRGAALDGDIVQVRLNPPAQWKLNTNIIALRWDEWSRHLGPIVDDLERVQRAKEEFVKRITDQSNVSGTINGHDNDDLLTVSAKGVTRTNRSKRSVLGGSKLSDGQNGNKNKIDITANRIPSNLPKGISKLKYEHIAKLPFAQQCMQKTGYVVQLVKRNHRGLAGGFLKKFSATQALFSPSDNRIPRMLIDIQECPVDFGTQANRYQDVLFIAQMKQWDGNGAYASGSLVKIVGDSNMIESRMETILVENDIYDEDFPEDAYKELEYLQNLPDNYYLENSKGRRDLTNECIFTIDPKTARDLDDAVSIKRIAEQIYEIGVHIADVSHFVREMSAVDYYARLRTTSVYLVDRVIPMLPRPLCEHMCSLNPGEPKLTFSVIWKMDKHGRIIDEWFGRTIIKSCVKLAYEHAQDMINQPDDISWIKEDLNMPQLYAFDWKHITKSVVLLNKIAKNMRAKRFQDGALKIDQVKIKYELDPGTGHPTGFTFEDRTDSNYLIEEYMLQANMSVAKRIYQSFSDRAFLRRHPASDPRLLKEVKEFCDAKGYPLDISTAGSIQKSLNDITDPTTSKVVSFLLLKSMKNAEYVCTGSLPVDDSGFRHFALNAPFYTHFTSPIRRYADVIVHRQLAMTLGIDQPSQEDVNTLTSMANECTKRKISSKLISETSQKLYFNLFIQKAGFCELLACVTRIYDHSFEVILVDYSQTGRVYLDRIKANLDSFKFESFSGVKRLVLNWKAPSKKALKMRAKKNKSRMTEDEARLQYRQSVETRKNLTTARESMRINEVPDSQTEQTIEVFDVIRVIVTVDEKDISKLRIDLKTPN